MNKYTREEGKAARQAALLELVAQQALSTQGDVVKSLKRKGIAATQVSVSRDIAELGLIKVGGVYKPATAAAAAEAGAADPELPLRTAVDSAAAAGPNLVVIRCDPGMAQRVGYVIDGMNAQGVVGTIAGDDTVFIAVDGPATNKRIRDFIQARIGS